MGLDSGGVGGEDHPSPLPRKLFDVFVVFKIKTIIIFDVVYSL